MNKDDITIIGETNFRNKRLRFGIKTDDRRRHVYIIGKTGTGKTTLLENMIISDIKKGNGVGLIEPHGDLAQKILDFIPSYRMNDVIYFDPGNLDYPIAFNPIEQVEPKYKHLVASGLIAVFKKIWGDVSWGPRLEYLLRNTVLALLDYPGSTMLGIQRMLIDKSFRKKVTAKIQDPIVKMFWEQEFTKYHDRFMIEAIAPIQNKVGQYLSSSVIRNIVAQIKSSINLSEVINNKKILILNLSKGKIGEDNSFLLGAMMITKLQIAAMERVNIPEDQRKDFYLYIDEFQNFATESFINILSEARKYRLDLILAHQYINQIDERVRDAIIGNVGTLICFRVGADDGEVLESEFTPAFSARDLINLNKYQIYLKLMIDGITSSAFSATTLPPSIEREKNAEKIVAISQEKYCSPRAKIEEKIERWAATAEKSRQEEEIEAQVRAEVERKMKGIERNRIEKRKEWERRMKEREERKNPNERPS